METKQKQQLDMLHGPIWNKLIRFALPVAATAILEQLFNASDVAIVGNFAGGDRTAAVAAVGANSPVIGELAAAPLLKLLQVPEDVFPLALLYLRIYLVGLPVILLYNFEAAIFRSVGETKIPLMALAVSGVINGLLNLCFVAGLGMSTDGVAIATVISNGLSALLLYRKLRCTTLDVRVELRELRIDRRAMKRILRIGLPAGRS